MSDHALRVLPSPFDVAPGQVLLREPPSADLDALCAALQAGTYERAFVVDDGEHCTLYLGSITLIQTVMSKRAPDALMPGYCQAMMGFLLFAPQAREIALVGLGGGALVKACRTHLPNARMVVVELNADIIAWRELFRLPPDDDRLCVRSGDGAEFIAAHAGGLDVLMIDAFDTRGFAPGLDRRDFVADAYASLARSGVMVVNLAGPPVAYRDFLVAVREIFDDQLLAIPVRDDGNHVLLAFKNSAMRPVWHRLHRQAAALAAQHGMDLTGFVRDAERVGWRRLPESLFGA